MWYFLQKAGDLFRRLGAVGLAIAVLWTVRVTAGSETMGEAWTALSDNVSRPLAILRWELGDLMPQDSLSPTTVMAISESPLLLSVRSQVADLWSAGEAGDTETGTSPDGSSPDSGDSSLNSGDSSSDTEESLQEPQSMLTPVEETPLDTGLDFTDNGIPAKTLAVTDPEGYTLCGNTYIKNSTDHTLSISELEEPYDATLSEDSPQILIIHTHGSESYTPPDGTEIVYSGNHRTTDNRYNVVMVGDEMAAVFSEEGIGVIHDRTLYDYPTYSGAYDRSLSAIQTYLTQYPSISIVLDVHRDAIEDSAGNEYKVISAIDEVGAAAQLTLVMGSDGSGLEHPQWKENLKFGIALQNSILSLYPTLMRPMALRNSRYNQHMTTGSLLVEVGAAGNSPSEAALAGRLFARQMADVLQSQSK